MPLKVCGEPPEGGGGPPGGGGGGGRPPCGGGGPPCGGGGPPCGGSGGSRPPCLNLAGRDGRLWIFLSGGGMDGAAAADKRFNT